MLKMFCCEHQHYMGFPICLRFALSLTVSEISAHLCFLNFWKYFQIFKKMCRNVPNCACARKKGIPITTKIIITSLIVKLKIWARSPMGVYTFFLLKKSLQKKVYYKKIIITSFITKLKIWAECSMGVYKFSLLKRLLQNWKKSLLQKK